MSIEYKKKRAQLRLNFFVALLLLGMAAVLSVTYGVVFFHQLMILNQAPIGVASLIGGIMLSLLCSFFLVKITKKLKVKLAENEQSAPEVSVAT